MKTQKTVAVLAAAVLAAAPIMSGCTARENTLKIYNWGDYIEDSLIGVFEEWYEQQTGEAITVKYETFDTSETALMRVETQKADYDLVCPSDYIAERMIKSGLALKVDKSIFDPAEEDLLYDGLAEMISVFDSDNEYYTPYCWGTMGIMYDVNYIDAGSKELESWSALWSDGWQAQSGKKRTLVKDSVRDAYSVAMIYANRDKLSELSNGFTDYNDAYTAELTSYFSRTDAQAMNLAKTALIEQKKQVCKYEVDDGKNDFLAGTTDAWLGMFWSCDSGLIMSEDGGDHFYYTVPYEGSNVWVDGWIIPKYAKNVKAANYFLKFINTYEYAAINLEWMGSSMANKAVMLDAKAEIEADDEFEDDYYEGFKQMYLEMIFPSEETLSRCAVMRDFGKAKNTELDGMWIDVKTT